MLELIISLLKLTFQNKKYTTQVYGLASFVEKDDKRFPAAYNSKDNYDNIQLEDSAIYFRQTASETQFQNDEDGESGCDELVTITYPLTAVAYVPKSIFKTDNAFIDNKVSRNIANIIENADYEQLRGAMKADDLRCIVRSVIVDRYEIWKREFSNIKMNARHDHVLCAVNFDVEIKVNSSCLENFECDDISVVIEDDEIVVSIRDQQAWHRTGDEIGGDAEFGSTNNYGYYFIVNGVRYWLMNTDGDLIPQQPNSAIGSAVAPVTHGYFGTLHYTTLDPPIVGGITSINADATAAQLLVVGTSGNDFNITDNGTGTHTFHLPTASATRRGALSSTDWNTFNNKESTANKGAANGYAPLGADTKIPNAYLPALAITDTFVVNSQAAMLALSTAEMGDVAVRTDLNKSFILAAEPYSVLANWQELLTPTDAVLSVNGQTGAVTLTTSNITEGTNLYYTDERVDDRVAVLIQSSADNVITWTYNDVAGTLTPVVADAGAAQRGVVTTGAQTFAGAKTLASISIASDAILRGGSGQAVNGSSDFKYINGNELAFAQSNCALSIKCIASSGNYISSWGSPAATLAQDLWIGRAVNSSFSGPVNYIQINKSGTIVLLTANTAALTIDTSQRSGFGVTPSARVHARGAADSVAFIADEDGGTYYIKCEETAGAKKIGFFNTATVIQQTGGAATAGVIYGATEQGMIQRMYDALRNYGLLT